MSHSLLKLSNISIALQEKPEKRILVGVDLELQAGKVYYLKGRNGSGKSSLVASIAGDPNYVVSGEIRWQPTPTVEVADLSTLEPDQRALQGIFLAHQHPITVPGVPLIEFLWLAYNARQEKQMPLFKFKHLAETTAALLNYPQELLKRNLNEGLSGGERKRTEILQMLLLNPQLLLLDETDSGLDQQAIKEVFTAIKHWHVEHPETTIVVISHYPQIEELLPADEVLRIESGNIVVD
jgi:Fe-S cluster assembly ATP-binding protein